MTIRREITARLALLVVGASGMLVLGGGCSDSKKEKLKAAALADGCSINSDCANPLVCAFERCHEACAEDRDCAGEARCVRGEAGDRNVCQLPDETECERDKDCAGEQVCGVDAECRDSCTADDDCTPTQVCANSNECASTIDTKDTLDTEGNILRDDSSLGSTSTSATSSSTGGAAGESSVEGSGGSVSNGTGGSTRPDGSTSKGGSTSTGNTGGAGAPGTDGAGGSGGSGGTGSTYDYFETDDGVEAEPNDTRETALPLQHTSSIYLSSGDQDWFSVQAPNEPGAHVIELEVAQAAGVRSAVSLFGAADNSQIGITNLGLGVTGHVYATVGSNSVTHVRVVPLSGTGRADITFTLTAENDEHEPNDTWQTGSPISVNSDVTGQLMRGYVSSGSNAGDDFFSVELAAGSATLFLPLGFQDQLLRLGLVNSFGASSIIATPAIGAGGSFMFDVPEAGTYVIHVIPMYFDSFAATTKPTYMSDTYTFQVQQTN